MTIEESSLTTAQVQSVRDRSLEEAYEPHDVGYDILETRLSQHGFTVVEHGDDKRHVDRIVFGEGPDMALYDTDNTDEADPIAYIEIKTKEAEQWFGRCNRRHFNEYVNFANEIDVPVFIWFALVDADKGICLRDGFFEVEDTDQIDGRAVETDTTLVVDREDIESISSNSQQDLVQFTASDIVNLSRGDQIDDSIPEVHGNEVVCLNEDQLRSMPYILHQLSA